MMTLKQRMGIVFLSSVVIFAVVGSLFVGPAVGQSDIQIDGEAVYDGSEADPPATAVTVTITASTSVTNITVLVDDTRNSFAAFETTDLSTSPAEVGVEARGDGEFFVEELNQGEEIEIVLDVYPRSIAVDELDVAVVTVEGPNLQAEQTITADLSETSYNQLQSQQNWRLIAIGLGILFLLSVGSLVGLFLRSGDGNGGRGGGGGISGKR